jgi:hypothetical protein
MSDWLKRLFFGAVWRLYQVYLILFGAMLFYWIFGIYTDKDGGNYIAWWMLGAFVFGFLFAWLGTILTARGIDFLKSAFSNKPPKQPTHKSRGETSDAPSLESPHRLGTLEKPDDFITLSPGGREHLR